VLRYLIRRLLWACVLFIAVTLFFPGGLASLLTRKKAAS
jgi:hypothetical protein